MTRPINYLIEVLGFEDDKAVLRGELFLKARLSVSFKLSGSLW